MQYARACVLMLYSCCVTATKRVRILFVYVNVGALHGNVRTEDLLDSEAGRLILRGLSKWAEEDRSHYRHYSMHPAVVPSA